MDDLVIQETDKKAITTENFTNTVLTGKISGRKS